MAERQPENLETENRKLRSQHREMSEDLTEQREMVRHLHSVIKNYEQLLRKTGQTSRPASSPRQSINGRKRVEKRCEAENVFVRKVLESAKSSSNDEAKKTRNVSCPALTSSPRQVSSGAAKHRRKRGDGSAAVERRRKSSEPLSGKSTASMIVSDDIERTEVAIRKWHTEKPVSSTTCNEGEHKTYQQKFSTRDFTWSYKPRDEMISHMGSLLDSMTMKVEHHQQSLKIKERHIARSERRLEYLESIALGQESEWL